ncbi:hypothetical protein F2Q69_00061235, partial [Brassica cretica]
LEKMGSEGPKAITIHVTGFKKFLGVSENPTEKIASNLRSYVEKRGLPSGLSLGSCTVLETAGEGAKSLEIRTSVELLFGVFSLLHLGVNSGATKFAIERQAMNEAHFRCPDQLGWQPQVTPFTFPLLRNSFSLFKRLFKQRIPIVVEDGSITKAK